MVRSLGVLAFAGVLAGVSRGQTLCNSVRFTSNAFGSSGGVCDGTRGTPANSTRYACEADAYIRDAGRTCGTWCALQTVSGRPLRCVNSFPNSGDFPLSCIRHPATLGCDARATDHVCRCLAPVSLCETQAIPSSSYAPPGVCFGAGRSSASVCSAAVSTTSISGTRNCANWCSQHGLACSAGFQHTGASPCVASSNIGCAATATNLMCFCIRSVAPTSAPTTATTAAPTQAPTTAAPTSAPSTAPSAAPTAAPTTADPTMVPTALPTDAPTTPGPTAAPTAAPTTLHPTTTPSVAPTSQPTTHPSAAPTSHPTTATPPTVSPSSGATEGDAAGSSSSVLVVVVAVVLVALVVIGIAVARRSRKRPSASQRPPVVNPAYDMSGAAATNARALRVTVPPDSRGSVLVPHVGNVYEVPLSQNPHYGKVGTAGEVAAASSSSAGSVSGNSYETPLSHNPNYGKKPRGTQPSKSPRQLGGGNNIYSQPALVDDAYEAPVSHNPEYGSDPTDHTYEATGMYAEAQDYGGFNEYDTAA